MKTSKNRPSRPKTPPGDEGYRDDLAYIHDAGFGQLARDAAALVLAQLRRQQKAAALVVELGCGSGIQSEIVAAAGHRVLGIDRAPAMLELARRRAPTAEFREASFLTADFPDCDAVTAVGEIFNYLFDKQNTRPRLMALLRRIHQALVPEGFLLFDVAGPGRAWPPETRRRFFEGNDWTCLVDVELQKDVLLRRIVSFVRAGQLYRRDEEVHRLRLYSPADIAAALRATGFRVRRLFSYGETRFPPGLTGFWAQKRVS